MGKKNKNKKKAKVFQPWRGQSAKRVTPVTKFSRPKGKSMTVSFTGKSNDFPCVIISPVAHGKMLALVKECPIEISWMSSVTVTEKGDFQIDDVYVPLQECGPADTVISEDGDAALMMELIEAGKAEELNKLRCWGHSHVNMGVFASGTDETQTQDFLDNLHNAGSNHFVRFIGNKHGALLCNVYLFDRQIILNNPEMRIGQDGVDYSEWAKTQIKEKVSRLAPVAPYPRPYMNGAPMAHYADAYSRGGWFAGDQFIEDDLNSPLFDDVEDEFSAPPRSLTKEELEDPYYDFGNRGQ